MQSAISTGVISRRMWACMWPDRAEEEVPIGHITNGVHVHPGWLRQMSQLYDKHFPANWARRIRYPEIWQSIHDVDPGELWETHNALKNNLLSFVRRRLSRQCRRRGESDSMPSKRLAIPSIPNVNNRFRPTICDLQACERWFSESLTVIADLTCQ